MDKLQLTWQNEGRVFYFRYGRVHAVHFCFLVVKLPNLKLKTRSKQVLGSLPLDIALPALGNASQNKTHPIMCYVDQGSHGEEACTVADGLADISGSFRIGFIYLGTLQLDWENREPLLKGKAQYSRPPYSN